MWTRRDFFGLGLVLGVGAEGAFRLAVADDLSKSRSLPKESEERFIDEIYRKQLVPYDVFEHAGFVVVEPKSYFLYQVRNDGRAIRYGVGVGREGFAWAGKANVMRKELWPDWYPPMAMRERQPYLPRVVPGGIKNPLGARALYLYRDNVDTLYRIHGTMEPETVGTAVSSGCIRMLNEHISDLYSRVPIGTQVLVI